MIILFESQRLIVRIDRVKRFTYFFRPLVLPKQFEKIIVCMNGGLFVKGLALFCFLKFRFGDGLICKQFINISKNGVQNIILPAYLNVGIFYERRLIAINGNYFLLPNTIFTRA